MLSPPTRRGGEAGYVRTAQGFEVDFHVRHVDGREELIQVCASIDQHDVLARVVRALQDAVTDHPRAAQILITVAPIAAWTVASIVTAKRTCLSISASRKL